MVKILLVQTSYPNIYDSLPPYETVVACFMPPADQVAAGKAIALQGGKFSLRELFQQCYFGKPDVVMISTSLLYLPNSIILDPNPPVPTDAKEAGVPILVKMKDTHHGPQPLQTYFAYAQELQGQFHWTTYNRHHLHFMKRAGLPDSVWIPGSVNIAYVPVKFYSHEERKRYIFFCGSTFYGFRRSMIEVLQESGLPLVIGRSLPRLAMIETLGEAGIAFNCTGGGELNLRSYETLSAGGFLLMERLAQETGMGILVQEGIHFEAWGSAEELLEKCHYYLAHPEESSAIAARGHEFYEEHLTPSLLYRQMIEHVLEGKMLPDFCLGLEEDRIANTSMNAVQTLDVLRPRLQVYEILQDIHRNNGDLPMFLVGGEYMKTLQSDFRDLPRHSSKYFCPDQKLSDGALDGCRMGVIEANQGGLDWPLEGLPNTVCILIFCGTDLRPMKDIITQRSQAAGFYRVIPAQDGWPGCAVFVNPNGRKVPSIDIVERSPFPIMHRIQLEVNYVLKKSIFIGNSLIRLIRNPKSLIQRFVQ